jgi:hypothetical protein
MAEAIPHDLHVGTRPWHLLLNGTCMDLSAGRDRSAGGLVTLVIGSRRRAEKRAGDAGCTGHIQLDCFQPN